MNTVNILFIGDIIGAFGRRVLKKLLPSIKKEFAVDFTVANGENSAHGYGITEKIYNEFLASGIDALTMGNHVWDKKELLTTISKFPKMVRPANYPPGAPGNEFLILETEKGQKIGLLNFVGRIFMPPLDCPFQAVEKLLPKVQKETKIIIVDIHAEASSEKVAFGWFLDGRVSAVLGTHTHVMTADEKILPQGTAFITDIGMVGSQDSVIGMKTEQILKRFTTGLPERFEPADLGIGLFNAILIEIDLQTGKAVKIEKIIRTISD